jgi:hypothetical protein
MSASNTSPEPPKGRFVVGTFDTWPQLHNALRDLRVRGVTSNSITYLALRPAFAGPVDAPLGAVAAVQKLCFATGEEPICCTAGPVADALAERLLAGAPTLQSALSHWLIPRHAAHFEKAVRNGQIMLWVQIFDAEDERYANQSLLATSSNSVGVHDLVPGQHRQPDRGFASRR